MNIKINEIKYLLQDIESAIWEMQADTPGKRIDFGMSGFRAACKIFADAMLSHAWESMEIANLSQADREKLAENLGQDLKAFIYKYTKIDSTTLYNNQ